MPVTQPRPSSTTTGDCCASPWKNTHVVPVRFAAESSTVSAATLAVPEPASVAPFANAEFAQPAPPAPLLPHGQGVELPSPAQKLAKPVHVVARTWKSSIAASTTEPAPVSDATKRTLTWLVTGTKSDTTNSW